MFAAIYSAIIILALFALGFVTLLMMAGVFILACLVTISAIEWFLSLFSSDFKK